MAMQSGAVAVPEKIPWYNNHQQHQMDERAAGFLMWMRGEFAAANAIIDALCHHLQSVGEPGEYDGVIGCVQQRRCNWNAVLHMQQYFSVAEVTYALQQAGWKRQQRVMGFEGAVRSEYRRGGRGQRGGAEAHTSGNEVNGKDMNAHGKNNVKVSVNGKVRMDDSLGNRVEIEKNGETENKESDEKAEITSPRKSQESTEGTVAHMGEKAEGCGNVHDTGLSHKIQEEHDLTIVPKTFVATEMYDSERVNVVDGMKLYENLLDDSEVSKLFTLVNDLRVAGRRGQLQGQTFTVLKRPMKGRGRETIQLGVTTADASHEDDAATGTSRDLETESMPTLLHDVIERLHNIHVFPIKPDSCVIDIFNEGDHSQPHTWPQWFGRPICVLFLTECEMSFGKVITMDHPGDYRGALKLSLSPGSILVMEGRSTDFARHAIPSQRKQRILVTLSKSQTHRFTFGDIHNFPSAAAAPSHWTPPPSRSPNHIRPVAAKHFGSVPTTNMSHAPTPHPHLPLPNGIQPIFVNSPVAASVTFPVPVALTTASAGWAVSPSRHPPSRLPVSGTGVFIPPQSSTYASNQPGSTQATENITVEASSQPEKENYADIPNGRSTSPPLGSKVPKQECNGSIHGAAAESVIEKQEQAENLDFAKSSGAV